MAAAFGHGCVCLERETRETGMGKSLLSDHSVVRADFDGLARRHHIGTNRHYVAPIFSRRDTTVFETAPFNHSGTPPRRKYFKENVFLSYSEVQPFLWNCDAWVLKFRLPSKQY